VDATAVLPFVQTMMLYAFNDSCTHTLTRITQLWPVCCRQWSMACPGPRTVGTRGDIKLIVQFDRLCKTASRAGVCFSSQTWTALTTCRTPPSAAEWACTACGKHDGVHEKSLRTKAFAVVQSLGLRNLRCRPGARHRPPHRCRRRRQ
jgi:hypothetical protein